jgi:galactose-6-phosphate isomerase
MALIDVSEIINDPDFQDTISLSRRVQSISDYGETVLTATTSTMSAVVQAGNGETLTRNPEYSVMTDWITIYAEFNFRADGNGYFADLITWGGRTFQVKTVTDFMNWGHGYTRADCLIEGAQTG